MEYNVPSIIRFSDSFGNVSHIKELPGSALGQALLDFSNDPKSYLRPGDFLSVEVEVDSSFPESSYEIWWTFMGRRALKNSSKKLELQITEDDVTINFHVHCVIIGNQKWHKYPEGRDDILMLIYKVLPPL